MREETRVRTSVTALQRQLSSLPPSHVMLEVGSQRMSAPRTHYFVLSGSTAAAYRCGTNSNAHERTIVMVGAGAPPSGAPTRSGEASSTASICTMHD